MKPFTTAICLGVFVFVTRTSAQNAVGKITRTQNSQYPVISVYVSSQAGDRITKKASARFLPDSESSLPVIKIDDSIRYQKIEGFGGTFNEAGMICLNSIDRNSRVRVFKSLFDSVSGAGFNLMKAPMASCDTEMERH